MKKVFSLLLVIMFVSSFLLGCGKVNTTSSENLKVENFVFCSSISGDRSYSERVDKTFSKNEDVLIYSEISNFTAKNVSEELEYWPVVEVEVKDPDGNYIIERQKVIDQKLTSSIQAQYLYFPITLTFPEEALTGEYKVLAYFQDMYSDRKAQISDNFFLK
jgi:hypothetical protein